MIFEKSKRKKCYIVDKGMDSRKDILYIIDEVYLLIIFNYLNNEYKKYVAYIYVINGIS